VKESSTPAKTTRFQTGVCLSLYYYNLIKKNIYLDILCIARQTEHLLSKYFNLWSSEQNDHDNKEYEIRIKTITYCVDWRCSLEIFHSPALNLHIIRYYMD
jgi:hypothetical protein